MIDSHPNYHRTDRLTYNIPNCTESSLFEQLYNALPEPHIFCDNANNIRQTNHAFTERFGYHHTQIIGEAVSSIYAQESKATYHQFNNDTLTRELHFVTQCGVMFMAEETVYPVFDKRNHLIGHILRIFELPANRVRTAYNTQAVIKQKWKRTFEGFVTSLSHDFRHPLTKINTSLYLMNKVDDTERRLRYAKSIRQQVDQLDHLIEDLILMARLDTAPVLERELTDINQLLLVTLDTLQPLFREQEMQVETNLASDRLIVDVDIALLDAALHRLLLNAHYYSAFGTTVTVTTEVRDQHVVISISDQGIGINAAQMPHIFDRFYKANQARTTNLTGAGLGLPIAKAIVESHAGTISVESTPDLGSNFCIVLPLDSNNNTDA